jgi:ATP-binding cassette, subfamily B, heavy metal transporter
LEGFEIYKLVQKMKNRRGEEIEFKYNLKEYWSVLKKHKWYFYVLLTISLLVEVLLTVDKFLFKRIIDDGTNFLEGTFPKESFVRVLIVIAIIFAIVAVSRAILKWFNTHMLNVLDAQLIQEIKVKYFNHILRLSHNFHTTHKTGSLISRLGRGSSAVESMTDIFVYNLAPLVFQIFIVGISLAYFSLFSTLVILFVIIVFIGYSYYMQQIQQEPQLKYNDYSDREKGFVGDIFTNVDSIKYYGKEKDIEKRFNRITSQTKDSSLKYWHYFRWMGSGQMFILAIGAFLLVYFPLMSFLNKEITLGTLVFIYSLYGNIAGPMFGFVGGMRNFYKAMADFQDLFEYGKIENEIKDKPGSKDLIIKNGEVEFRDVDFKYGQRKIFSNLNLKIKPNEKVALVGHSGSGKTTLVKLLNRFYDVNKGVILIDGQDIRNFKQESLRGETGIVPQECILFDDTLYNNVKFSKPEASRKEVMEAIRFAQLDKIIKRFPNKENTIVGERGVRLSGGEKQRVSIARAILANKKVLVLDEATSSLDSETEHEIQKDLQRLLQNRTSIIIAHRLSTIMDADRIIVFKEGKIIQQGKHVELIRQPGEYKKLWTFQKGGYIEE